MDEPQEFKVGDHEYRFTKPESFIQFEISRKLLPVLAAVIPAFNAFVSRPRDEAAEGAAAEGSAGLMGMLSNPAAAPLLDEAAKALAAMSGADSKFIIGECMARVQRKDGTRWADAWNKDSGRSMFSDIGWTEMIACTQNVAMSFLRPF